MKQFYVYIHKKPDGTPVYVGKGHGKRAYKLNGRNPHHQSVLNKYEGQIIIEVTNCENEQAAFELEKIYINQLRDQGYRLCNQTDGGEGVCGYRFDPETIERIAAINRTKVRSDEFKAGVSAQWKGVKRGPQSEERRLKNAQAHTGKKQSEETKAKRSAALKGKERVLSEQHISKIREFNKTKIGNQYRRGAKHTDEAKEKNRQAHLGIKQSQATIDARRQKLNKPRKSATGITMVYWYKPRSCWVAKISIKGAQKHLGYFEDYFEACCARKSAELTVYKDRFV